MQIAHNAQRLLLLRIVHVYGILGSYGIHDSVW